MSTNRDALTAAAPGRGAALAGGIAIAVGLVVLLGWAFDLAALKSVIPGFVSMKSNTALCFILSGLGLVLLRGEKSPLRQLVTARVCALTVSLAGGLSLLQDLAGVNLGLDEWLFRDDRAGHSAAPGRMAPATAFNFLLVGWALLAARARAPRLRAFAAGLALVVGGVALLAVVGYAYEVRALYGVGPYTSMAVHTALTFLVVATGLMRLQPDRGLAGMMQQDRPGSVVVCRLLPVAIGLPVALGGVRLLAQRAGWFETEFGLALMVLSSIAIGVGLIWWTAGSLNAAEAARRHSEEALHRIEWLLTRKDERPPVPRRPWVPPYGNLLALNRSRLILEAVGEQTLTDIASDYLDLLDTAAAVHERNGDYALGVFASDWCRFINTASRARCGTADNQEALACGRWDCHESCWTQASKASIESNGPVDVECAGRLRIYAVPIHANGQVIGSINFGYGDPPSDEARIGELAALYQVSVEELRQHAAAYESRPPFIIELAKRRLHVSARLIGEIVERKQAEKRLRVINRMLTTLSECNQALVRAGDEAELLETVCRKIVKFGGYPLAWVELAGDGGGAAARREVCVGDAPGPKPPGGATWADTPQGRALMAEAIRTGRTGVFHDLVADPAKAESRAAAGPNGCVALIALPLLREGRAMGALGIHSPTPTSFDADETSLLTELATDLAFGLQAFRTQAERHQATERTGQSEERFRSLVAATAQIVWTTDAAGNVTEDLPTWRAFTGQTLEESRGAGWVAALHPDDRARTLAVWQRAVESRSLYQTEYRLRRHDGAYRYFAARGVPVLNADGGIREWVGFCADIHERRQADERLAAFATLAQRLNTAETPEAAGEIILDIADRLFGWDACTLDLYSAAEDRIHHVLNRDTIQGQRVSCSPSLDNQSPTPRGRRVIEHGAQLILREPPYVLGEGVPFGDTARPSASIMTVPLREGAGVIGLLSIQSYQPHAYAAADLEALQALADHCGGALQRIQVATARRVSEARYRLLFESSRDAIMMLAPPDWRFTAANAATVAMFHAGTEAAFVATAPWEFSPELQPDSQRSDAKARAMIEAAMRDGSHFFAWRHKRLDGGEFPATVLLTRFELDGQPMLQATVRDVTKEAELETRLRQSQKMDAIGHLAGGVAHDFNNILAVILMQVDLEVTQEGLSESTRESLIAIKGAAERAAALTRQLLLFSRREVMRPQTLDLNDTVTQLTKMLRRTLGEDIRLQLDLHALALWTRADPGMLDQVLLNLAVNARDAMPGGGSLTIATTECLVGAGGPRPDPEAAPGRYVRLSVSDTGCGIAPEILPRIFEPFFTTKEAGKGTGLGLATVFGIVKQHKGWLEVRSRPGEGATFHVHLPAAETPADVAAPGQSEPRSRGGTETILLVEDDPAVRLVTRLVLERNGYRVHEARNGAEALDFNPPAGQLVDLLLTDLVLPSALDGRAVAAQLQARWPQLKVIFMSGYSPELAGRALALQPGQFFLQKPIPLDHLLETIRLCFGN